MPFYLQMSTNINSTTRHLRFSYILILTNLMYQLIPLHSCDYLNKISIKTNVATDEGNSRNEMRH